MKPAILFGLVCGLTWHCPKAALAATPAEICTLVLDRGPVAAECAKFIDGYYADPLAYDICAVLAKKGYAQPVSDCMKAVKNKKYSADALQLCMGLAGRGGADDANRCLGNTGTVVAPVRSGPSCEARLVEAKKMLEEIQGMASTLAHSQTLVKQVDAALEKLRTDSVRAGTATGR